MRDNIYDLVGIGAGVFNLSLASLLTETNIKNIFFDAKESYSWHKGMQLDFATIQNSQTKDLVSLANPKNKYSFQNFLHEQGRLESHTIANFEFIKRWEFEQYLQWVVEDLDTVCLGKPVSEISKQDDHFKIKFRNQDVSKVILAKNICVGTGVVPFIPDCASNFLGNRVFHNSEYNFHSSYDSKSITIIGGGQSALEIAIDLLKSSRSVNKLTFVFQEQFIHQIEDSQFAEDKIFTTTGLNFFYNLDKETKKQLNNQYRLTSDGASPHTIQDFYQMLYTNKFLFKNKVEVQVFSDSKMTNITQNGSQLDISIRTLSTQKNIKFSSETVILATGYRQQFPFHLFSEDITKNISFDTESNPILHENYSLQYKGEGKIFTMNMGKHTHGVADPNLSLNAIRAKKIIASLSDKITNNECKQFTLFGGKK